MEYLLDGDCIIPFCHVLGAFFRGISKVEVPKPARIRSFGASITGFAINSRTGVLANGFQRC
jgi:hypothetical protein